MYAGRIEWTTPLQHCHIFGLLLIRLTTLMHLAVKRTGLSAWYEH